MLWNDAGMYVGVLGRRHGSDRRLQEGRSDPHLWTKDTVEMMVDPDGDGDNKDYYEIQINPQNLVFDSQFDAYNEPKVEPDGPFGHQEWSANLKSAVSLDGTVDKSTDEDRGYTVEAFDALEVLRQSRKAPARSRLIVAHQLLRHEEQRRRLLVTHLGPRQLSQSVPLRPRRLDRKKAPPPPAASALRGSTCSVNERRQKSAPSPRPKRPLSSRPLPPHPRTEHRGAPCPSELRTPRRPPRFVDAAPCEVRCRIAHRPLSPSASHERGWVRSDLTRGPVVRACICVG